MIDFINANQKSLYFESPSNIVANGDAPKNLFLKSVFCASGTHFERHAWLSGRLFASTETASKHLEELRSYGVGFRLFRVPMIILTYRDIAVGMHTYNKYSAQGYNRLLSDFANDWPDFWRHVPDLTTNWLRCFPISVSQLNLFSEYCEEAYRSYFLGPAHPIQWEKVGYPFESGFFKTFIEFYDRLSSLHLHQR